MPANLLKHLPSFLAAALLAACVESTPPDPAPQAVAATSADRHEQGRKIYNFRCYYCHGYSGNARTLAATYLTPKPRDFTTMTATTLSRQNMLETLEKGRPGTAMKSFSAVLGRDEREAVIDFVRREFMERKAENTRYHTAQNAWPDHQKYAAAFPFATHELPLDTSWETLSPEQQTGKRLYLSSCITCHDRARVANEGKPWDSRPLSYPRNHYSPAAPVIDAMASASPYALHDRAPQLNNLTTLEKNGESVFQENCAFCHAADGTGRNWIGSFLEPHPRDLTNRDFMASMTKARLRQVIREGLPGTSMPAWKAVLTEQEIQAIIAYVARAFHPID